MREFNRTTTYESLLGVIGLLLSDTKEDFCYYYQLATGDSNGNTAWYYMYHGGKNGKLLHK